MDAIKPEIPLFIDNSFKLVFEAIDAAVYEKRGEYLSETELLIMQGALNDVEYEEICSFSDYSLNYLQRSLAPKLWSILSDIIGNGGKVGKKRLKYFLELFAQKNQIPIPVQSQLLKQLSSSAPIIKGKLPEVSDFVGRSKEIILLKDILDSQKCISLLGLPGIGKTALAAKFVEEVKESNWGFQYEYIIWKSVLHCPTAKDLVAEIIHLLDPDAQLPEATQANVSVLIKLLGLHRCLIVLDGFESLFLRNDYNSKIDYGLFLNRFIEEEHDSSLILTNRTWSVELYELIVIKDKLKFLRLEGLDEESAVKFLTNKGLSTEEKFINLIQTYNGNPSELEAVATRIKHFFGGDVEKFLANQTTLISDKLEAMLNEMFRNRLTPLEVKILIYLAEHLTANSGGISFSQLLRDIKQAQGGNESVSRLIRALEKLQNDSLITTVNHQDDGKEPSFTLEKTIKKYISSDPSGFVHR